MTGVFTEETETTTYKTRTAALSQYVLQFHKKIFSVVQNLSGANFIFPCAPSFDIDYGNV